MANKPELYTGISGEFLREYAAHAVRDYIVDQMNLKLGWDSELRIYPILDSILGICKTREEGAWPRGRLVFSERKTLERHSYITRFPEKDMPLLENYKHVRKLLMAVERSSSMLVSDGVRILGIGADVLPEFAVMADFHGQYGYLNINDNRICSFSDGRFKSTTHRAKLVQLEEALLESDLDAETSSILFQIVARLVHHAESERFGCTLVIDLNSPPVHIAGQQLEQSLDLRQPRLLQLAQRLSKVDGALHIGRDIHLIAFACLLDGHAIDGEDRARGARFNSALRFTTEHPNIFVVVVSSDRPVSIIQEGVEISAQCQWKPVSACKFAPQLLTEWLTGSDHRLAG